MAASYYLDVVYTLLLDSARQADQMSSFGETPTHNERDLKDSLGIVDVVDPDPTVDDDDWDEYDPESNVTDIRHLRSVIERVNNVGTITRG
jgi:hypothetical protein